MRFSVSLPRPDASTEFAHPYALSEMALAVEGAGLDACTLIDHPFPLLTHERAGGQAFDMFAVAGFLAAATTRLEIHLNLVVMGLRNPFLVARAIATVDHLATGRLLVGIGAGYMEPEFAALGADFSRRVALVDEGVIAMKAAWTGDPVVLDSATWRASGNVMLPRPFTDPHPKLFRGGNTSAAMRSAVANFDGWSPFEAPPSVASVARTAPLDSKAMLRERLGTLREMERQAGRVVPLLVTLNKPDSSWLNAGAASVQEEIAQLEAIGIDRVVAAVQASSKAEFIERVNALGAMVS
jgi:alkanesulfonate monooxygenase SsuD/methylene tetrahydromethanopterin reductase-like flavin-dependent oxidoreductase (luciferase family)